MIEEVPGVEGDATRKRITIAGMVALGAVGILVLVVGAIALDSGSPPKTGRQPPLSQSAGPATYKIERRVLVDALELSGTFVRGGSRRIDAKGFQIADGSPIVTRVFVKQGQRIPSGTAIVQIGSEPIFVVQGPMPMYRDLTFDKSGDDVAQLQATLTRLGYANTDAAGYFGGGTSNAVLQFYNDRGYRPVIAKQTTGDSKTKSGEGSGSAGSVQTYPVVKLGSFNYVPRLPLVVASVDIRVGSEAGSSLVTLSSSSTRLTLDLQEHVDDVRAGMTVAFELDGARYSGVVAKVLNAAAQTPAGGAEQQGDAGAATVSPTATVAVDRSVNANAIGQNVQVTVIRRRSRGPVTVVPVSAVLTNAAGENYLRLVGGQPGSKEVPVDVGWTASGFAVVTPRSKTALAPGLSVEVGAK